MNELGLHNHNGINSKRLSTYDIIPTFVMTSTELTRYLSRNAIEGEEFNVFDGTNYRKYIRVNSLWKYIALT